MPSLETHQLRAGYGKLAILHGLTFKTMPEGITAILGANGAGKTTTLRTVMGLTKVYSGLIKVDGVDVTGWPTHKLVKEAGLAIVPEGRQLFAELSVRENLVMGAFASGISNAEMRNRIDYVSGFLPIVSKKLHHKANTLSGGEQQMVAIGRALMNRPRILLADEVSQGVSPLMTQQLWEIFRQVSLEQTSVIMVEQNVAAALRVASHAIVIRGGCAILEGASDAMASDTRIMESYLT